ncbi:unnamed protein product [Closterium sp. Yama58-4]|nr:unnamed protein product [Closterium sp. Yama58-4]
MGATMLTIDENMGYGAFYATSLESPFPAHAAADATPPPCGPPHGASPLAPLAQQSAGGDSKSSPSRHVQRVFVSLIVVFAASLLLLSQLPFIISVLSPFLSPFDISVEEAEQVEQAGAAQVGGVWSQLREHRGSLALLFLTRGPIPLAPLWEKFLRGHEGRYAIYVHASNTSFSFPPGSSPLFRGRLVPGGEVRWGEMSMVDAERRLLEAAVQDEANSFFVLLSESCIPLWPFDYVYSYIASSSASFVDAYSDPYSMSFGRYIPHIFMPVIRRHQFLKGNQWFILQRRHAEAVVRDTLHYTKHNLSCAVSPPRPPLPAPLRLCSSALCSSALCSSALCSSALCSSALCSSALCSTALCSTALCSTALCSTALCSTALCSTALCSSALCSTALCSTALCSTALCSTALCSTALCSTALCSTALCSTALCSTALCSTALCSTALCSTALCSTALCSSALCSTALCSTALCSSALCSSALCSTALCSTALCSTALCSTALCSTALCSSAQQPAPSCCYSRSCHHLPCRFHLMSPEPFRLQWGKLCCADEHYIQTFLHMTDPRGISRYPTTFTDWSANDWHPSLYLGANMTDQLITTIKTARQFITYRSFWQDFQSNYSHIIDPSAPQPPLAVANGHCVLAGEPRNCFLFARKFHPSTLPFLMRKSQQLLGF